ncbi:MAG: UDP-4-amino-4,6-dideoxy-N-acetyl-beta-L-altrosamine transaminase [Candidatus Pacebacteria bacterium]|jgi:UDP-4-amino-4,6-dideoxy-N-acetyl-beta-L-altrosamine transaminase|nr:UDP-4-amino-4,6-dideoxy-N-acetyl-beta-L-altrosamine transaminase [Candidatus Paceibacterota bacterium]
MIPYGRQNIDHSDINAVVKTLKSDFLTQGPKVLEFEKALAKYCGARYAVAVSSGTAGLHLAYLAVGIKHGDEVLTTPNTFVATANMIIVTGAKPVFCDIREDTYNIDEKKIEKLITKKTKAIVPVHFAGHPCEMTKIKKIAKKHKITVIEDACHALGAKYKNKKIGNIGGMAVFSFHPVKPITTGEGGAVVTNDKKLYEKLLSLRSHGIHKDKSGKNVMTELGYNYRLTDIQSALGISQLKRLNSFIKRRRDIVRKYEKELSSVKDIILPKELSNVYSGWHLYIIRVKNKRIRDKLMKYLKKNGIGVNFHYPAVYSHPYYRKNGFKSFSLSIEEKYHSTCITLPLYPDLKKTEIRLITNIIKSFFSKI